MVSVAVIKALQVYGIAIVISLIVAVLIKVMVVLTGRVKHRAPQAVAKTVSATPLPVRKTQSSTGASAVSDSGIPGEVIAAISAAVSVVMGPHRILHVAEKASSRSGS